MLTPADVEQKTFSTALRGYDLDEVDDFLDEVVATIKDLHEQLEAARAARGEEAAAAPPPPVPETEPEPRPEPAVEPTAEAKPKVDESAIGRALVAAQTAADELLEEAQTQAEKILEEAKDEADSFISERDEKKREAEAEMAALSARVASVRSELSVLAGEVSHKLDDMDEVIAGVDTDTGPAITEDDEGNTPDAVSVVDEEAHDGDDRGDIADEYEFGATEDEGYEDAGGESDHLDEMLTGVNTDLQLSSEDSDESQGDGEGDGDHDVESSDEDE